MRGEGWTNVPPRTRSLEEEAIRNVEAEKVGKKEISRHVYRNADEIRRYLELWPIFAETSLMGSDEPYDRKARGSSRVPMPEKGVLFLFDGEGLGVTGCEAPGDALSYLAAALASLYSSPTRIGGTSFADVARALWNDPGAARMWEEADRFGDGTEEDKVMQTAFRGFSLLLSYTLAAAYPDAVVTLGTDEQRARAATRLAYNRERRSGKEYALGEIGGAILRLKEEEGLGTEDAVERFRERLKGDGETDQSRARCYEALAFVRGADE